MSWKLAYILVCENYAEATYVCMHTYTHTKFKKRTSYQNRNARSDCSGRSADFPQMFDCTHGAGFTQDECTVHKMHTFPLPFIFCLSDFVE